MLDSILEIINKFVPDKEAAQQATVALEKEFTKQMQLKNEIIIAENANGSGKWRVRLMYLCMFMVAIHFILYDIVTFFVTMLDLDVWVPAAPDNEYMWTFLYVGVGGYIGSRGVEKTTAWLKLKK